MADELEDDDPIVDEVGFLLHKRYRPFHCKSYCKV